MRTWRFLMAAILLLCTSVAFPDLAAAKKRPRARNSRKSMLAREVFKRYPALKAIPDETSKMQNDVADKYELPRLQNRSDLERYVESGYLVRVPDKGKGFYLDGPSFKDLGFGDRRYLTPLARPYLIERLAPAYSEKFSRRFRRRRLEVTTLVRTQDYQEYLCKKKKNKNACQALGSTPERRSAHLTGYTFDTSTNGLSKEQILWLAHFLDNDTAEGIVAAIYEPNRNNFHVMVIPK